MAALRGVARGAVAAPRRPALVKPSRHTPTQHRAVQSAGKDPELACTDILGHQLETSLNRKDGPYRALREAVEQSIGRAGARGMKLLAQISLGSGSRSAAKRQL